MSDASAVLNFALPAERLKLKGQVCRITHFDGSVSDFRVVDVSYPDESGAVTVSMEAVS